MSDNSENRFDFEAWEDEVTSYLNNTMSYDERLAFETAMSKNKALKDAVEFEKALNQKAHEHLLFKQLEPHLNEYITNNNLDSDSTPPKGKTTPLSIKGLFGLFALLVLIIVGIFVFNRTQKDKQYSQIVRKWIVKDPFPYTGNDTLFQNDPTAEAIKEYNKGNYHQAEVFFKQTDSSDKNKQNSRLYRAINALLITPPNTVTALEILKERYPDKMRFGYDAIEWYLALAYLQNEDLKNAREILNNISDNSMYTNDAKNLLSELSKNGF